MGCKECKKKIEKDEAEERLRQPYSDNSSVRTQENVIMISTTMSMPKCIICEISHPNRSPVGLHLTNSGLHRKSMRKEQRGKGAAFDMTGGVDITPALYPTIYKLYNKG